MFPILRIRSGVARPAPREQTWWRTLIATITATRSVDHVAWASNSAVSSSVHHALQSYRLTVGRAWLLQATQCRGLYCSTDGTVAGVVPMVEAPGSATQPAWDADAIAWVCPAGSALLTFGDGGGEAAAHDECATAPCTDANFQCNQVGHPLAAASFSRRLLYFCVNSLHEPPQSVCDRAHSAVSLPSRGSDRASKSFVGWPMLTERAHVAGGG
jgi:hypothetical protein